MSTKKKAKSQKVKTCDNIFFYDFHFTLNKTLSFKLWIKLLLVYKLQF